jgi:hypothetical protein
MQVNQVVQVHAPSVLSTTRVVMMSLAVCDMSRIVVLVDSCQFTRPAAALDHLGLHLISLTALSNALTNRDPGTDCTKLCTSALVTKVSPLEVLVNPVMGAQERHRRVVLLSDEDTSDVPLILYTPFFDD